MMRSNEKRLVLLAVVAVVAGVMLYSLIGRDSRLPAANPDAAVASQSTAQAAAAAEVPGPAADRVQELQQRLADNPRDAAALSEMVDGLFQAKRYAQAAELLSEAIDAGADVPRLHMGLGVALFYEGMPSLAQRELKRAIELDPNLVEARFNYALTLTHAARPDADAARAAWQEVVQRDPDGPLGQRAREYLQGGQ